MSTDYQPGVEVTVTVTGRVIYSNDRSMVVEYLSAEGMPRREAFDTKSPAVAVTTAPYPMPTELALRERAARLMAHGCEDDEMRVPVQREHVDRWNDAYPERTEVRYWTGEREGEGKTGWTSSSAWLLGGHTAVVRIFGEASCIALSHVEPITAQEPANV